MTLLADRRRPAPSTRAEPTRRSDRLGWHVTGLVVLLVLVHLLVGPGQLTQADEGAALAQARSLADGGGWSIAHPLPAADPAGTAFPIERSERVRDSFEYVPYARHPAYPLLLAGALRVAGESGAVALSIIGAALAALGAALLARRLSPELALPALWCTGVASPLLFYSDLVIAHTIAAAAVAFAVLALTAGERPRVGMIVAGATLLMVACLLRNEAVLLGPAIAVALALDARRRLGGSYLPAVAAVVSTVGAYLLDPWLQSRVLDSADVGTARIVDRVGYIEGRFEAFRGTVLSPADVRPAARLFGVLFVVALVAAAWLVRRNRDVSLIRSLLVVSAVAAVGRLWKGPTDYVPGLLPAAPVIAAGLIMFRRRSLSKEGSRIALLLGTAAALFALAVSATQYSYSFGPWGGRYYVIGLPLIAPLAAAGLVRARQLVDATTSRVALSAIVIITVALAGVGVTASHTSHELRASLDEALAEQSGTLVISLLPGTGRFHYQEVLDGAWLETTSDDLAGRAPALRDAGVTELILLTPDPVASAAELAPQYVAVGEPIMFDATTLGVTSVLVTRMQRFEATIPSTNGS